MALVTPLQSQLAVHKLAQRGYREFRGTAAFSGASVSDTIAVPGFTVVDSVQLTPVNAVPVAGDLMACGSVILADGTYTISNGTITVTRAAGTTANLKYCFVIRGR